MTLDGTFAGRVLPAKFHTEMLEFIADCVAAPQTWKVLRSQLVPLFYLCYCLRCGSTRTTRSYGGRIPSSTFSRSTKQTRRLTARALPQGAPV